MSKVDAHLRVLLEKDMMPHRAFSLFLFNSQNQLLIQQRSSEKITFPRLWTNTCCSHPMYSEDELETRDNLGIKRAAIRRANFELGITDLKIDDLHLGSRILYYANGCETFAEYEVDYIIFAKKNVPHNINENEIAAVEYVGLNEFDDFLKERRE